MGDLNAVPASLAHQLVVTGAPVRDVWRVLHPESALGAVDEPAEHVRRRPIPTAGYNLAENGVTCGSVLNTWRWPHVRQKRGRDEPDVPPDAIDRRGRRLDYIFASTGDVSALSGGWVVRAARIGMVGRHPELGCSLSDHFSVEADLVFHPKKPATATTMTPASTFAGYPQDTTQIRMSKGAYLQSPTASIRPPGTNYDAQLAPFRPDDAFLPGTTYDEILAQIRRYMARERAQRRWRGVHFCAWVLVTIGCYVAVWFSPYNYVTFVLMLLCSLGLAAGTVDGLIALLFVNSEIRALKEFEWEILNAKAAASGGAPVVEDGLDKGW